MFAKRWVMRFLEKTMAYSPPLIYSRIEDIQSIPGPEAEGWLISVGATPRIIMYIPSFHI